MEKDESLVMRRTINGNVKMINFNFLNKKILSLCQQRFNKKISKVKFYYFNLFNELPSKIIIQKFSILKK